MICKYLNLKNLLLVITSGNGELVAQLSVAVVIAIEEQRFKVVDSGL